MTTESLRLEARRLKPSAVALPGSKSISNRTLLLAALSDNDCEIRSLLKSDDTDRMLDALRALGVKLETLPSGSLKVFPRSKTGRQPGLPSCFVRRLRITYAAFTSGYTHGRAVY